MTGTIKLHYTAICLSAVALLFAVRDLPVDAFAQDASLAVAASILTTVYHMLRDGTCYQDLGPEYFTRRNRRNPRPDWPIASAISVTTLKLGLLHEAPDRVSS